MKLPRLINAYAGKPVGPSDWEYGLWLPGTSTRPQPVF
jgi:hypothetical protein